MAKETQAGKIYVTFTIDKNVKKRFNIACSALGLNMSEAAESMMINFLDISDRMIKSELDRLSKVNDLDVDVEVINNKTRLEDAN